MDNKLYDFSSLEKVCAGDDDFMNQMIEMFKTNIPKEIDQMKNAIQNSEFEEVKRIAHKIKPSVGYICVDSLLGQTKSIEEWDGDGAGLGEMVDGFVEQVDKVITQLDAL
jgi:HPt (histidine-containing phosphotransfer) domain-containing protein